MVANKTPRWKLLLVWIFISKVFQSWNNFSNLRRNLFENRCTKCNFENISLDEGVDALWGYNTDIKRKRCKCCVHSSRFVCLYYFFQLLTLLRNSYRIRIIGNVSRLFWIMKVDKVTANNETKQEKEVARIGFFKIEITIQLPV